MTLTVHRSLSLDAATRGAELGQAQGPRIQATWATYERVFDEQQVPAALVREVGERALDQVAGWAPHLAAETAAIAHGAGLEVWQSAALSARSEVLAHAPRPAPGECSTSVHLRAHLPPVTIQTWDWHHWLDQAKLLWQLSPRPGRVVKTFTEFGLPAKIGVNDGVVRGIERGRVLVEEESVDFFGERRSAEVVLEMASGERGDR